MSRSIRKRSIAGVTAAVSEKREVIDPWAMRKEGKLHFDAADFSLRQGFG